jgi:hypothetical protein
VVGLVVGDFCKGAGEGSVACACAEAELEFCVHVVFDLMSDGSVYQFAASHVSILDFLGEDIGEYRNTFPLDQCKGQASLFMHAGLSLGSGGSPTCGHKWAQTAHFRDHEETIQKNAQDVQL